MRHLVIEPLESRIAPAVFTVTTLGDSGVGSLRDALAKADSTAGVDTIKFHLPAPMPHAENVITLLSGLTSKGDVIIDGPGAGRLIIDANNTGRILTITDGSVATNSPATISGLTFTRGDATGSGGAILSNESLTLKNVVVLQNQASGNGGGVAVGIAPGAHVKATITGSQFIDNFGSTGGGLFLYNLDSLALSKSLISRNSGGGAGGGGAYIEMDSTSTGLTVSGCQVSNNTDSPGAGLFLTSASMNPAAKITISSSVITGNSASATGSLGGAGIYVAQTPVIISGCIISGNTTSSNGGGIQAASASVTVTKSILAGNVSTGPGGGFYFNEMKSVQITGSTISGNKTASTAHGSGGGYVEIAATGTGMNITSSLFTGNEGAYAGGLWVNSYVPATAGTVTIAKSKFLGNQAKYSDNIGGGGLYLSHGTVTISGTTISNNIASGYNGGGVDAAYTSALTISHCTISGNQTLKTKSGPSEGGGGLFLRGNGLASNQAATMQVSIADSTISDNRSAVNGGGISATNGVQLNISKSTFTGNDSFQGGGAIRAYGLLNALVNVTIDGSTITGNTAAGGGAPNGGGIDVNSTGLVFITATKITGNSAGGEGGGAVLYQPDGSNVTGCTISGNSASGTNGGGGLLLIDTAFNVTGGVVSGNFAVKGGGIETMNGSGNISGVLITHNTAQTAGGGIYNDGSMAALVNGTIVTANTAVTDPDLHGTF